MIRQICPHCQQSVEFDDGAAGTRQPCPDCGEEFAVPGRYAPAVDPTFAVRPDPEPDPVPPPPAAPPGFVPPGSRAPTPRADAPPRGPATGRAIVVRPEVLDWFPAGCFTLILILTLFPWVGLYPGGHAAYTQSAWGAAFGRFSTDSFAESVIGKQVELAKLTHMNWVMLIYLLGLFLAVAVSWLDRAVAPAAAAPARRMGIVEAVWPHRFPILAGLALGLLALLVIQTYAGFGLDTATERMVAAGYAKTKADAATPAAPAAATAAELQKQEIKRGMDLGQYDVGTTFWLGLAIGTHVVALLAVGLRLWLYRRGSKPLPRLVWEA